MQTSQNKQLEQEKQNDSVVKQGTASKSSDENVSSTTKSMPNYSKLIILSKLKIFMLHKLLKKLDANEKNASASKASI